MQLGARGAQRDRQATKKLMSYSREWSPGDTMRVFFNIIWLPDGRPDLLVGQVWGHPVNDVKELGLHTTFIPSTTEFDSNGKPVGTPDVTYQFSRIAPIFVNGQRAGEMAQVANKPWPSTSQKEQALDAVKKKYDKDNRNRIQPIIGPAKYVIMTEVVSVKYVENQGCVKDTTHLSSWSMSDKQLRQVFSLMDNPKYAPNKGDKYFEIEITYPADPDKGKSGQSAVPAGLTPEYRLCNTYPDDFKQVETYFESWSADSDTIRSRATTAVNEDAVLNAIKQYSLLHSEFLDTVDNEDDIGVLERNIDIVNKVVSMRFLKNEELQAKLQDAIRKMEEAQPIPVTETLPEPSKTEEAPAAADITVEEAPPAVPDLPLEDDAPRMANILMNNPMSMSADGMADLLDGIDIGNIG